MLLVPEAQVEDEGHGAWASALFISHHVTVSPGGKGQADHNFLTVTIPKFLICF